jgi:hypothetical protein
MSIVGTTLMPISNIVSWYLIAIRPNSTTTESQQQQQQQQLLYDGLFITSVFYASWALFNIVIRKRPDLGVVTMSFLAVTSYMRKNTLSLIATPLIIINYLIALPLIIGVIQKQQTSSKDDGTDNDDKKSSTSTSTSTVKKIWPWIFLGYIISNLILYSVAEYKLWKIGNAGGGSGDNKDSNHGGGGIGSYSAVSSSDEM